MIDEDTLTYRYLALLAILANTLITVIICRYAVEGWFAVPGPWLPLAFVANLAAHLVLISALRHPKYVRQSPTGGPTTVVHVDD